MNLICDPGKIPTNRSAKAKKFDDGAVFLAVKAHIRHTKTNYNELLAWGYDRASARSMVDDKIQQILELSSIP